MAQEFLASLLAKITNTDKKGTVKFTHFNTQYLLLTKTLIFDYEGYPIEVI